MSDLLNKVKELLENAEYKHGGQGEDSNGNDKLEYDCSGVVIDALNKLGYNIPDMSAGDMQNSGYFDVVQTSQVEPGDIIVTKNANGGWHTAVVNEDTSRFVGAQSSNVWDQPFGPNAPYWNKPFIILRPKPNLIPNDAPDEPRDGFNDAKTTRSPIVLDLDGDGWVTYDEGENGQRITNELFTLSELGIHSIDTGYTNTNITDANGNIIKQTGTFTWEDGTTGSTADVWLQTDNMYTIANEWLDVPDDIAALPNLCGYGNVYNLHQAMVRDESGQLKTLVEQFAAETVRARNRENLFNNYRMAA